MVTHSDSSTFQRIHVPTPHGGTYSVAYFTDSNRQPVSKDQATHVKIVEYDEHGKAVFRTYGNTRIRPVALNKPTP